MKSLQFLTLWSLLMVTLFLLTPPLSMFQGSQTSRSFLRPIGPSECCKTRGESIVIGSILAARFCGFIDQNHSFISAWSLFRNLKQTEKPPASSSPSPSVPLFLFLWDSLVRVYWIVPHLFFFLHPSQRWDEHSSSSTSVYVVLIWKDGQNHRGAELFGPGTVWSLRKLICFHSLTATHYTNTMTSATGTHKHTVRCRAIWP